VTRCTYGRGPFTGNAKPRPSPAGVADDDRGGGSGWSGRARSDDSNSDSDRAANTAQATPDGGHRGASVPKPGPNGAAPPDHDCVHLASSNVCSIASASGAGGQMVERRLGPHDPPRHLALQGRQQLAGTGPRGYRRQRARPLLATISYRVVCPGLGGSASGGIAG
jgi:hypothetical protein